MKHHLRRGLCWVMMLVMLAAFLPVSFPAPANAAPQADIQNGVTLHCWNWSFKNIEANMSKIAALGYTAIQTSPIQQAKQATSGFPTNDWWVYYQPMGFHIDNSGSSALGTKAEFKSMCATAEKYGIKVIVDVVANHMGDNGGNNLSPAIISDSMRSSILKLRMTALSVATSGPPLLTASKLTIPMYTATASCWISPAVALALVLTPNT